MNMRALSLFSGCGGLCEGIEMAGFEVVCAVENDKFAAETYRFNFPKTYLYEGDIKNFLAPEPEEHIEKYNITNIDLVFGGPPCQGYSQIGTRCSKDQRNFLFKEFARVIEIINPKIFIMENVPNLLLLNKGFFKDLILEKFKEIGYKRVSISKVYASDYGVPQERCRVFFVGLRDDCDFEGELSEFVSNKFENLKIEKPVTVWEAISDLPKNVVPSGEAMKYNYSCESDYQKLMKLGGRKDPLNAHKYCRGIRHWDEVKLHNHHTKEIQERRLSLIKMLEPGKKADSLPKSIWNGKRPEKWRRLHPDKPAYTLLANMHRDLSEFVHPTLDRWITVREAARLQSFHDGFVFVTSEWQQLKQIGNAVPPLLGKAVGLVGMGLLDKLEDNNSDSVIEEGAESIAV